MLQVENLSPELFQKALYGLRTICGKRRVLPRSYIISEGLSRTGEKAIAAGGYADVWQGEFMGRNAGVCIKAIRVTVMEERREIEKVCNSSSFSPSSFTQLTATRYFTRRSPYGCD